MARTILIADDSPTIRKIVELTFSDTDIRVETARSGAEALDRMRQVRPDLVLADVVMPEPDGYDLCRSIKSSEHPVPVVLLAGTFEPFDADRARDCGADSHLVKPFESDVLRERVRALLDQPASHSESDKTETEPEPVEPEPAMQEATEPPRDVGSDSTAPASTSNSGAPPEVTTEFVEAVAEVVVRRLAPDLLREVALRVVPELATEIIRERIRELEQEELDEERGEG